MNLYFFDGGTLDTQKHVITFGRGLGEPMTIPVPFFLVRHPRGNVLFDTGMALELIKDPEKHWGPITKVYYPRLTPDQFVVNQLAALGLKPEDIAWVVQSHLHLDHAGGTGCFPKARYLVQRRELEWAYVHDFYHKGAYIRADFDRPVPWLLLDGAADDGYDLFGDGALTILFTPGHTPGHQSLLVRLEKEGLFLLTGDCCYTGTILNEDVLPGLLWSPPEAVRSIRRLRYARDVQGATIVTGHDPAAWPAFRKAPQYYPCPVSAARLEANRRLNSRRPLTYWLVLHPSHHADSGLEAESRRQMASTSGIFSNSLRYRRRPDITRPYRRPRRHRTSRSRFSLARPPDPYEFTQAFSPGTRSGQGAQIIQSACAASLILMSLPRASRSWSRSGTLSGW
jgi:N-acyl homoserine lactone hydrolase